MKKSTKILTGLVLGTLMASSTAFAAEEAVGEFTLDQIIVTAQRMETHDLDTPAIVEVYDEAKIEKTGASNAYDVVQNTLGVNTQSQGFHGTAMGTMTSKIMIRGVEKGTLVLVNGVPMNMDGKYNLEDIPTESIEKVEVVKGGGSVLYGSEATGGVINIITKKQFKNSVKVEAGNFGKERYLVSVGAKKFNIVAGLENRGHASPMSGPSSTVKTPTAKTTVYDYGKGERKSVMWNWQIADGLTFTHNYSKNEHQYWQKYLLSGQRSQNNFYKNEDNQFLVNYNKDDWKINASYGTQYKRYDQNKFSKNVWGPIGPYSNRKGHNVDLDVQKAFNLKENKLLVGATYLREDMDAFANSTQLDSTYKRNNYSIYASYDWKMNEDSHLIVNARQTWAQGVIGDQTNISTGKETRVENRNMKKFTPEIEYTQRLNDNSSIYAKAGKSFRLPNLTQIFGSGVINPALNRLNPEQGTHYEAGYKLNTNNAAWRFAIFKYKIIDSIDADVTYDKDGTKVGVDYYNEDVTNTGVELSCNIKHSDSFSSNWGVTFQNPKAKNIHTYGDKDWHSIYNRYQLNGALNYNYKKLSSSLSANFVGNRTSTRASASAPQRHLKPQCFTDFHISYAPAKNHKMYFHLNNLFDRLDITTNSTANYYSLGRNFIVGYEYSF